MADTIHLTNEGYKRLQERLEYLSTKRREEITEDIAVARSFGDLSENSEYDAARKPRLRTSARSSSLKPSSKMPLSSMKAALTPALSVWDRSCV